jgi:hypothetical protein
MKIFKALHDKKEFFWYMQSDAEKSEVVLDSRGQGSFQH